jgi:hypothetical protein
MASKFRDSNMVRPIKLSIEKIMKASKEEIVPLASGLLDVLDTCLSRSLSKKSLIIHPADLITIDPIANIKNK